MHTQKHFTSKVCTLTKDTLIIKIISFLFLFSSLYMHMFGVDVFQVTKVIES